MDIDGSGNVSIVLGTFPVVVDGSSDGKTLNVTISIAGTPAGDLAVSYEEINSFPDIYKETRVICLFDNSRFFYV